MDSCSIVYIYIGNALKAYTCRLLVLYYPLPPIPILYTGVYFSYCKLEYINLLCTIAYIFLGNSEKIKKISCAIILLIV